MTSQKGFAHYLVLLLLLAGIGVGMYLVQNPTIFKSKAAESTVPIKKDVQIWFHPNMYFSQRHSDPRKNPVDALTFWQETNQLKEILPKLAKVGFFPGYWPPANDWDEFAPQLQQAATALNNNHVAMDVSIGGVNSFGGPTGPYCTNHQAGEVTASNELTTVDKMVQAGLPIDSLTMDDPIGRTILNGDYDQDCAYTIEESIQEVIDAMKIIHAKYPNFKIGINVNFANWRYNGIAPNAPNFRTIKIADYKVVLDKFFPAVRAAGEEIAFVHIDNPYEHTLPTPNWHDVNPWVKQQFPQLIGNPDPKVVDWMQRVIDLENQVKSYGVRFGVFFNAGMMSPDAEAYNGTIRYVTEYRAKGGRPDDYVLKSWGNAPSKLLPASEPYTYTNLLTTVMKMVNTPPEGTQEGVNNSSCLAGGWAYDADLPGKSITVSFFRDNDADHGGTLIGSYTTDILRTDVNGAKGLPSGSKHGYSITFNSASGLLDGKLHKLYVYGHDATDTTGVRTLFPLLQNSPKDITCPAPKANTPLVGVLEGVVGSPCLAGGWAYDPDVPEKSLTVSFFRDNDADHGGTLIGSYTTDILRADVNTAANLPSGSKHGYSITFNSASGLLDGKLHKLYVYGHDATDTTGVRTLFPLLQNSPKDITCPAP